jgi:monofunctional glycosyltransferase
MSRGMADAKPRKARRVALGAAAVALAWLFGVWPPPVWWRNHWPRATAMMRLTADSRTGGPADAQSPSARPTVRPTGLTDISPLLQRMVIIGEDSRFRTHYGIDPAEIADALGVDRGMGLWGTIGSAWRRRDRLRGASTITQQLAKNLYLSSSRNPLRKLKEGVTALRLELAVPKNRILALYLSVVEWGPGVWGADAASRAYFGVPASRLTAEQAAALAATLPHPRTSNPTFQPDRMLARRNLILARYHGRDVRIPPEEEPDSLQLPAVVLPPLESLTVEVPAPTDIGLDSLTIRTDAREQVENGGRDSLP